MASAPGPARAASPGLSCELLTGSELHERVIEEGLLRARHRVWIATADLKDMHVRRGRGFVPVLTLFDEMAARGVEFRIIHSSMPSRPFRETLEGFPGLTAGALELQICPRSHWKLMVVDGALAYVGSANFTGAGLGARGPRRRNFEMGTLVRERAAVAKVELAFDALWMGEHCPECALRERCPDPVL